MPIYDFRCENGHEYSRRVAYGEFAHRCLEGRCSAMTRASSVYGVNHTHPRFWGGELPHAAERARDEYLLAAAAVKEGIAEETANGWQPQGVAENA